MALQVLLVALSLGQKPSTEVAQPSKDYTGCFLLTFLLTDTISWMSPSTQHQKTGTKTGLSFSGLMVSMQLFM